MKNTIQKTQPAEQIYFAAANSSSGFYSCFGTLFSPDSGEWDRIYIIKGGPGTGKSGFLRKTAEAAESRGYAVEYFLCSSDPTSLDGIRIPKLHVAMLDGTAPHAMDPKHPGAVEELLNMGMFFNTAELREHLPQIRALQEKNAAAHRLAARYLRAAGELRGGQYKLLSNAYPEEKARRAAGRLLHGLHSAGSGCHTTERIATAISTKGVVHVPTAEETALTRVCFSDRRHHAALFLKTLLDLAKERGIPVTRFVDPLCTDETEALYFPETGTLYYTDRYERYSVDDKLINTDRYFDREQLAAVREKLRFSTKCINVLLEGACEALHDAGMLHDELEDYYIHAMDFPAKETYTESFLSALFENR